MGLAAGLSLVPAFTPELSERKEGRRRWWGEGARADPCCREGDSWDSEGWRVVAWLVCASGGRTSTPGCSWGGVMPAGEPACSWLLAYSSVTNPRRSLNAGCGRTEGRGAGQGVPRQR